MMNIIKQIMQYLLTLLKDLSSSFAFKLKQSNQKWQLEQQLQQQQVYNWNMKHFMYQMAEDLAIPLMQHVYPQLQPVSSFADIRIKNYQKRPDGIIYQFTISKKTDEPMSVSHLHLLKERLMKDIATTRDMMGTYHDTISFMNTYPFLYCGLYILSISDIGSEICIYVTTDYTP